jgi:hypothetical protein
MITKKSLMVAVLCTFCLTAALLGAIPVESAGTYDPWIDTNHDGRINVLDLIKVAGGIGTTGNPGLNVTVTNPTLNVAIRNWPNATDTTIWWNASVSNSGRWSGDWGGSKGFAHLNVLARCNIASGPDTVTLIVYGELPDPADPGHAFLIVAHTETFSASQHTAAFSIPAPSSHFEFYAVSSSVTSYNIYLSYYLTWA